MSFIRVIKGSRNYCVSSWVCFCVFVCVCVRVCSCVCVFSCVWLFVFVCVRVRGRVFLCLSAFAAAESLNMNWTHVANERASSGTVNTFLYDRTNVSVRQNVSVRPFLTERFCTTVFVRPYERFCTTEFCTIKSAVAVRWAVPKQIRVYTYTGP